MLILQEEELEAAIRHYLVTSQDTVNLEVGEDQSLKMTDSYWILFYGSGGTNTSKIPYKYVKVV